jgi:microcystin-dependent protein
MGITVAPSGAKPSVIADANPSGLVRPYVGTSAHDGWLMCDGSAVSRITYASLFRVIQTAFGYGDQSTTFNLPDLRGQFVRGADGLVGVDPDALTRVALKPGGNTGNSVGSSQGCKTKAPINPFTTSAGNTQNDSPAHTHSTEVGNTSGSSGSGSQATYYKTGAMGETTGNPSITHTHPIPALSINGGDSESRPTNVYVNYIIKI